jgi:hypothetical protein
MRPDSLRLQGKAVIWLGIGAALAAGAAALLIRWNARYKLREEIEGRIRALLAALGARDLDGRVWSYEGRRVQVEVEAPGLFGGPLSLTVAMFTDRVGEFYVRRAGGLPAVALPALAEDEFYRDYSIEGRAGPALQDYLRSPEVREVLRRAMAGRWRVFGKGFVILYFSDNVFDARRLDEEELRLALRALRHLDRPAEEPLRGGAFTFRSGFEPDLPPWHWTPEARQRLPENALRVVVSYYHENPCLNEGLVEFFYELAAGSRRFFLTDERDLAFLGHAFGDEVSIGDGVVESARLEPPAAADQYLDGGFFSAFVAADSIPEPLRAARRHARHDAALASLGELKFYARRLLDDEASWFSGEYEVLTLATSVEEIARALEKTAARREAKILPLDRRFTLKVFRDEKFEYST